MDLALTNRRKNNSPEHSPSTELVKHTILIIDDDELFLAVSQIRLEAEGYRTFTSQTGEEGIKQFEKLNPELVLLDFRLPSMSSDSVFKRIKTLKPDAKIITISSYTSSATVADQMIRGAESFYDKAMKTEQLITQIQAALAI